MLTAGLLGGMRWESTAHCYRAVVDRLVDVESALDAAFAVPTGTP